MLVSVAGSDPTGAGFVIISAPVVVITRTGTLRPRLFLVRLGTGVGSVARMARVVPIRVAMGGAALGVVGGGGSGRDVEDDEPATGGGECDEEAEIGFVAGVSESIEDSKVAADFRVFLVRVTGAIFCFFEAGVGSTA